MTNKRVTANELLNKIQENRNRRKGTHYIYSKTLDAELAVQMIPLDEMLEILSVDRNDFSAQMEAYKQLIYEHCPILHNQEYQSDEYLQPYDVVFDVFDNNFQALMDFSDKIIDLYGLEDMGEKIKN